MGQVRLAAGAGVFHGDQLATVLGLLGGLSEDERDTCTVVSRFREVAGGLPGTTEATIGTATVVGPGTVTSVGCADGQITAINVRGALVDAGDAGQAAVADLLHVLQQRLG